MKKRALILVSLFFLVNPSAQAESSLAFDSALGFTTNGYLTADNPISDRIFSVSGTSRFGLGETSARAFLKFTDFGTLNDNDLVSADFGTSFKKSSHPNAPTYGLRASLRNYIRDAPASTDQGFTHFGVIGTATWQSSTPNSNQWLIVSRADLEYFPSYFQRTDADLSVQCEYSIAQSPTSNLAFGLTPDLIVSTQSDFSKFLILFSVDYDQTLANEMSWGASATAAPALYLSRTTNTTATIVTRSGRNRSTPSTVSTSEKESTFTLTPSVWWAKELTEAWELRLESNLNLQSSKSGTYNFSELQAFVAIHYRVF